MLEIYAEAFAEHEAARRQEMLTRCLAPDAAIWGHSHVFAGYAAISEKIAGFQQNFPDCRLTLASGLFAFDNIVRFATAIVGPDGAVRARGETVCRSTGRPGTCLLSANALRVTIADRLDATHTRGHCP